MLQQKLDAMKQNMTIFLAASIHSIVLDNQAIASDIQVIASDTQVIALNIQDTILDDRKLTLRRTTYIL